ncbi:tRNA wybutosine-synthesizing protein 2 homolog [Cimex lectularius]|uniref:tRNA(Phe) (4-demethylwyosine(37)-C(7)) aminocarboxypropyltransferase n=1 Tax=Cimex lectularius TaxID=79782 RepID=A0A8I6S2B9_CIMLE|nr:tRNA wybutosine-synthesizing protein 2 homolog [Cimex lectularius]
MSKRQIENQEKIRGFMLSKKLWTESLTGELPRFYEKFGDMLIFTDPTFQNGKWHEAGDELWKLVCSLYNGKRIGLKSRIKNDDFRTPQARLVFGDSPHTDFKDNKIRYTWNIEKNMFCAGNITERHRIASLNCKGEVVVDLFAGIGYFTLPYLVHANAKFVHACEWNPDAVEALKKNLILNKVSEKCAVHFGDNREVCPKGVADRVNLGLIPSSRCSWETACDALLPSGGILYIHENVTSNLNIKNDCHMAITRFQPLTKHSR